MRTGVHDKKWNALQLIPKLRDWGASLVTVSFNCQRSCFGICSTILMLSEDSPEFGESAQSLLRCVGG